MHDYADKDNAAEIRSAIKDHALLSVLHAKLHKAHVMFALRFTCGVIGFLGVFAVLIGFMWCIVYISPEEYGYFEIMYWVIWGVGWFIWHVVPIALCIIVGIVLVAKLLQYAFTGKVW